MIFTLVGQVPQKPLGVGGEAYTAHKAIKLFDVPTLDQVQQYCDDS